MISKGLTSYSAKTITDPEKLRKSTKNNSFTRICRESRRTSRGGMSIAAPVKNNKGKVIASVSIAGPTSRINQQTISKLTKQVQQAADDITMKLLSKKA